MAVREASGQKRVLTFRSGGSKLAVTADSVREVFRKPKITRVPHAPPSLLGVAQLRGAARPIVSLARLIQGVEAGEASDARVLLIDADPEPVALLVDEITGVSFSGRADAPILDGAVHLDEGGSFRVVDVFTLLKAEFAVPKRKSVQRAPGAFPLQAARAREIGLLTFGLGEQTYALPLSEIAEVLPIPEGVATMPNARDAALGLARHRDGLLPIVSLATLLGLSSSDRPRRVIVVRLGEFSLGLAVDELKSIRRVGVDAVAPVPPLLNRGGGEAQIQSVCRLDGHGLASILSTERLFREDVVSQILQEAGRKAAETGDAAADRGAESFLVFRLADEEYGVGLSAIDEVVRLPDTVTRVPRAPAFVEGVINVRGRIVPLIDQHRRLGVPGAASTERRRVLVTTIEGRQAGFVVDGAAEIVRVPQDRISQASELAGDGAKLFTRVARLDDRMILLVDPKELLDGAERDLLDAMETEKGLR